MRVQGGSRTEGVVTGRKSSKALAHAVAVVATGVLTVASAGAATVYWDGDGVGTPAGGSGQWDTTRLRFAPSPASTTYTEFNAGDTVVFGGEGGAIYVPGAINGSIDVQSNGYSFLGTTVNSAATPILTWGGAMTANVAAGVTTELRLNAVGPSLTKTGAGTLVFDSTLADATGSVTVSEGTLRYGRSNVVASTGNLITGGVPNTGNTTKVTVAAGATLDFGQHFNDAVGSLNGAGTVVLGSQQDSNDLVTSGPSYVYGSNLIITGGNTSATGTSPPSFNSVFSGNIVSDGLTNSRLPLSGGRLVVGTITALTAGAGLQATVTLTGNNTYHGPTLVAQGATLYVGGGHALPDDQPVSLAVSAVQGPLLELLDDETMGSLGAAGTNAGWVNPNGHTLTIGADGLNGDFNVGGAGQIGAIPNVEPELGGTVVKVGTGTQLITLANQSSFTGKYRITAGTLSFNGDKAVGAIPDSVVSDQITIDGGTLGQSFLLSGSSVWTANRGITVTDNGGGLYGFMGSTQNWDLSGPIASSGAGTGGLTKAGPATLRLRGADNSAFGGKWTVSDGVLAVGGGYGASAQGLGNTPMGTGSIDLGPAQLQFVTDDLTTETTDQSYAVAAGAGAKFSFGPGSSLLINKGANASLTVTMGDPASTTGAAFVRNAGGTLLLMANTGASSLGTAGGEMLKVNGGVNAVAVNASAAAGDTLVPGVIVSTNTTATEGYFASYGANGFKVAAMSPKTDINTADATDLYAANSGSTNTLSANAAAYGVKAGAAGTPGDVDLNGHTLSLGGASATDPAVLMLSAGSNVKATGGGTLAFGNHEGVIYAEVAATSGTLAGNVTGSQGLTKMGFGALVLDPAATLNYSGPTRLHQGTLTIGADNQLPAGTDLVLSGVDTTNTFGRAPTLDLANHTVSVNSLNSTNEKNYNSGSNAATIYLGTSGILRITGSGISNFDGGVATSANNTQANLTSGVTSTLWMAGSGTLNLGRGAKNVDGNFRETFANYARLWVTDGGTVTLSTYAAFNSGSSLLPTGQTPALADAIKLDNGTLSFVGLAGGNVGGSTTAIPNSNTINSSRGFQLGTGGGTINVESPYQGVSLAGTAGYSGTGTLTKTGGGILTLANGANVASAAWKLVVKGGIVNFNFGTTDDNLGPAPASFDPTNITLDGGEIDASVSASTYVFSANRGIFITANGGIIGTGRSAMTFNQPLSGTGPLKLSGSTPVNSTPFNASSDGSFPGATEGFSGTVTLARSGTILANAKNALGTGTITNDPTMNISFGSGSGTAAAPIQLDNHFVINKGNSFDFIVNGAAALRLNGQVSGDGDIFKGTTAAIASAGLLELNNATNNFTGKLVVTQGSIAPLVNGALGATSAPLVVENTGALILKGVNYSSPKPLQAGSTASAGTIQATTGDNSFAGPISLTGAATVNVGGTSLTLSGAIVGASDSPLTKSGTGTLKLTGASTYSGATTLSAGTLILGKDAFAPVLTGPGGINLNAGTLILDYAGGSTPIATVNTRLHDSYVANYASPALIRSTGTSDTQGIGSYDNGSTVILQIAYYGDANLDGKVNFDDYALADRGMAKGLPGWVNGDFNYDGTVDQVDYLLLDTNYANGGIPHEAFAVLLADREARFGPAYVSSLLASVPEPTGLGLVIAVGAALSGRRRRARAHSVA